MAQQTVTLGATANDGTGDPLRTAFGKLNDNDTELYEAIGTVASLLAGELLAAGDLVTVSTVSGVAKMFKASATDTTKPAMGFVVAAVASGVNGRFHGPGQVNAHVAGLTPGTVYYLATTAGGLTATAPSAAGNAVQPVGVAISATQLAFFPLVTAGEAERIRDAIGTALTAGTGITVTPNDGADTITVAIDTAAEAERVRDVIGAAIVGGTGITATVDDAGDTITLAVDTTAEAERIRDVIGAALVAGTGVTVTVNDAGDTITLAVDATAVKPTESLIIAASDETTALSAGTAKVTFRTPYAFTVTDVRGSLTTAQTSGSIFTVDVNEAGTSILSTKLTIDNTEKTSTTAATARVISDSALADDAEITIDIDQIGDGTAKGLKVVLIGHRT